MSKVLLLLSLLFTLSLLLTNYSVIAQPSFDGIYIKSQDYSSDVVTITFPKGDPGTTVSNPYNSANVSYPQIFGNAGEAKPVVTLYNSSSTTPYIIWIQISEFTGGVVAEEYYLINEPGAACSDVNAINQSVSLGSSDNTQSLISPLSYKDLYLKVKLGTGSALSGTSTITILGEP